jgi:hypothetical protein
MPGKVFIMQIPERKMSTMNKDQNGSNRLWKMPLSRKLRRRSGHGEKYTRYVNVKGKSGQMLDMSWYMCDLRSSWH